MQACLLDFHFEEDRLAIDENIVGHSRGNEYLSSREVAVGRQSVFARPGPVLPHIFFSLPTSLNLEVFHFFLILAGNLGAQKKNQHYLFVVIRFFTAA